MTPFENLIQFLTQASFSPWFFLKLLYLLAFLLYVAFALIVLRQVSLMVKTLEGVLQMPLKLTAWIHLGVAVLIFFLALFTL